MGTIIIRNRDNLTLETNPALSLLQLLGRNGIAIPTKCGGRARCGWCKVTFHAGLEHSSPPGIFELHYKEKHPLPEGVRLACQTYVAGDCEISIGQKPV